jgi:hypothetical protein
MGRPIPSWASFRMYVCLSRHARIIWAARLGTIAPIGYPPPDSHKNKLSAGKKETASCCFSYQMDYPSDPAVIRERRAGRGAGVGGRGGGGHRDGGRGGRRTRGRRGRGWRRRNGGQSWRRKERDSKVEAAVYYAMGTATSLEELAEIAQIETDDRNEEFEYGYSKHGLFSTDVPHEQIPDRAALLRRACCPIQCRYALLACSKLCQDGRASAATTTPLMARLVALPPPIQQRVISFFKASPSSIIYDRPPIVAPGIYVRTQCNPCCMETTVLFLYPGLNIANYDDLMYWCPDRDKGHWGYCRFASHYRSDGARRLLERAELVQSQYQARAQSGNLAEASLLKDDWYNVEDLLDYAMDERFRKFEARKTGDGTGIEISPGYGPGSTFRIEARPDGTGGHNLVEKRVDGRADRTFRRIVPFQ